MTDTLLSYEGFKEELAKLLQEESRETIEQKSILKNNNTHLDAVLIHRKNSNIAPTIYILPYYQRYVGGQPIEGLVGEILGMSYPEASLQRMTEQLVRWEDVGPRICYRLVNREYNEELLKHVPHKDFLNLAVVYYYLCETDGEEGGTASVLVSDALMKQWGVTAETLAEAAERNTPHLQKLSLKSIVDIVREVCPELDSLPDYVEHPMYVMTNESKWNGACTLLYHDELRKFAEQMESDFFILPSSIHEVLLVPRERRVSAEELLVMVKEVNCTQVSEEEKLADNVYYYERESGDIYIAA